VVDLPGVYSLTAFSLDEIIARDYVVNDRPDVVVDVIDASNLERNLYLAVQILEMETKLVIALNMMDVAGSRGYRIDVPGLSQLLGAPVVPLIACRDQGTHDLLRTAVGVADGDIPVGGLHLQYGRDVEEEISKLETLISSNSLGDRYPPRWLALKLLEGDEEIIGKVRRS
jgi:ferrous iron transport protein B